MKSIIIIKRLSVAKSCLRLKSASLKLKVRKFLILTFAEITGERLAGSLFAFPHLEMGYDQSINITVRQI